MAARKSRSGTNISDERRAELGHETLYLRPATGTGAKLATLAALLGTTKADALAAALDLALSTLHASGR